MSSAKVASKIARSGERRRLRNSSIKTRMKTAIGGAENPLANGEGGEAKAAQEEVVTAISNIDRAVSKGIIHRNRGARLKSRLARRLNQATLKKKGD